jgi:GGDEF domain-containing protein
MGGNARALPEVATERRTSDGLSRLGFGGLGQHGALHDARTGLPNRSLLADRLSQAIARAGRIKRALRETLVVARNEYKYVAEVDTEFGACTA